MASKTIFVSFSSQIEWMDYRESMERVGESYIGMVLWSLESLSGLKL